MLSNFDQRINRYQTASMKWDAIESLFGESDLLPMWVADMDFRSPLPVIQAIKQRADHGIFGYSMRPDSYYEAIINWIAKRHNWLVEKDWICHSPGVVQALSFIIHTFSEPRDKILIQSPVYYPFSNLVRGNGRELVNNPLQYIDGQYQMDFDDLRKKLDSGVKVMILCSPHNPVGRVWTKEELLQLGELCLEKNVMIVVDEIHWDLVYKGYTHTPFATVSDDFIQNIIVCTAPSKTFNLAGLQSSNIIIPNPKWRKAFNKTIENYFCQFSSTFSVVATESAYRYGEAWLEECLKYLEENLYFLINYVKEYIPGIQVIKPEGTYLVWLDCRELGMDAKKLEKFMLKQAKVALNQGYVFGQEGEGFVRINIACPRSLLSEGLKRIKEAVYQHCR